MTELATSPVIQDLDARQRALDTTTSFVVSAPAGSGKTELLIQRILKLLSQADQPENILAITFTRKAASEMHERIITALEEAENGKPVDGNHQVQTRELANSVLNRDAELAWDLLLNPTRLRIQTIDAFCRQIANQLCLDTGISLPPQLTEDTEEIYRLAAEQMLSYMEQDSAQSAAMRQLVNQVDGNLDEISSLFANLLGSRDSWLPLALSQELLESDYLEARINALVEETLDQAAAEILLFQSELEQLLDYALTYSQENPEDTAWLDDRLENELPSTEPAELDSWKALAGFLTTAGGTFRKSADKRLGFPSPKQSTDSALAGARKQQYAELTSALNKNPKVLVLLNRIQVLPDPEAAPLSDDANSALLQLLPTLAAEFAVLSQERGETDYTSLTMTALRALGEADNPTPLALRLDYRINHILVDEFQDTSNTQVKLLERLTAGWQPDEGRTLFLVGDGMQSIYSFRKADVTLFMRARQFGIGDIKLEPLDLTANFRSEGQVVDWVNQTFQQTFPDQDDLLGGQVGFRHADIVQPASDWQVQMRGFGSEESEAKFIASDISEKLQHPDESIAILVRGRTHLRAVLPALREKNIQWQAQDIDPLAERMAVMDIHCLTRALCVSADRIAWLSILRAPWAGLDNADLYHLCQWRPDENALEEGTAQKWPPIWTAIQAAPSINNISATGKQILLRVEQLMRDALTNLGNLPLRNLIENLWLALDGESSLFEYRDRQDVSDYLDLLGSSESAGSIPDWPAFERKLTKLYAQPSQLEAPENEQLSSGRVQIMTIHKSKGLEFDHVYVPALGRKQKSNDNPLLLWWEREFSDGTDGYLLSTKPARGEEDDLYKYLKIEQNNRERHERARLLYVACTRAKKSLCLSAALKYDEEKDQIKKPESGSMLSILWDSYTEQFSDGFVPDAQTKGAELKSLRCIRRIDPARSFPNSSFLERPVPEHTKESEHNLPGTKPEVPLRFSNNFLQRIVGNILHDSLMRVVREALQPETSQFKKTWQQLLDSSGVDTNDKKVALETLSKSLEKMSKDEMGQWLLDSTHQDSEAELELDYLDGKGRIQRAIIDRTFLDAGTRWIVDYKSSSPREGEELDAFMARESDAYRAQMIRYSRLFESDMPVKAMLYFPVAGCHTEIDLQSK